MEEGRRKISRAFCIGIVFHDKLYFICDEWPGELVIIKSRQIRTSPAYIEISPAKGRIVSYIFHGAFELMQMMYEPSSK